MAISGLGDGRTCRARTSDAGLAADRGAEKQRRSLAEVAAAVIARGCVAGPGRLFSFSHSHSRTLWASRGSRRGEAAKKPKDSRIGGPSLHLL